MNSRRLTPAPAKPGRFYGWYVVAAAWVMLFLVNAVSVGIFFKPILWLLPGGSQSGGDSLPGLSYGGRGRRRC